MKNSLKRLFSISMIVIIALNQAKIAMAVSTKEGFVQSSAKSGFNVITNPDKRIARLRNYLQGYPLEDSAEHFITMAEKYGLEKHPYLVAAIGGLESTYGKFIPSGSYNAWGFGIPTGAQSGIVFKNWNEGIEEVTKTIARVYLKNQDPKELTTDELIYFIGPIYAASPTWAQRVSFIFRQIENAPATPSSTANLPLDL